ncbi:response regulator transcription factor [Egibacter rhizosphaerae]|uniref:Response regulator transcription factor n=1 Tax=Egibacter rhizosphaerae TaxID=1670831 RepID=A0A411YAL7_9ACTN|nr:response regulator transcription factor [Egibacter rhizosphaerae]QBI18222.1 response regulator transcription factor [Egibacter rhizosphaerae]
MRVLLVSSGPRVTDQVTTALTGDGEVHFTEVRRPERAVLLLDAIADGRSDDEPFDVVVGDNDTQPTGGFYLSREMKARERMGRPMPPVILLMHRRQDEWLARWAEADAWVIKPVDPFDLADAVEALAEGRPIPRLPGVVTFEEAGPVKGPGQPGELPGRPESRERALGSGREATHR